jgi:AcrR family transcriptional regulator
MEQIQRARILAAAVHAVCELGVADLTVANVVERAGVSRRTFYELFGSCEACLLATLEDALARTRERVLPAYEREQGAWRRRMRAGLLALLEFFDERPQVARLLIVEWLASGPRALERRRQVLERIASAVDEGRTARLAVGSGPPQLTAEGVVGAVASVLHGRLARAQPGPALVELVNPLMGIVVLPYLGTAAARGELEQTVPASRTHAGAELSPEDTLRGLKMRLTYRTLQVLAAVAEFPGSSNRAIARAAGVGDQGQISKLLMRLCKLGLLENNGMVRKGEPNAWSLTVRGEQVERALRISSEGKV